jgi:hypothetical protein
LTIRTFAPITPSMNLEQSMDLEPKDTVWTSS